MRGLTRALCLAIACGLVGTGLGLTQDFGPPTVTVRADGACYRVSSVAQTVSGLLVDLGITLGDLDRTAPALAAPLADGMEVCVTRVSRRRAVEEEIVSARTVVLPAFHRPPGFSKTVSKGRDGLVRRFVETWTKDGEVTRRTVLREQVVTAPADAVVLRGASGLPSRGGDWRRPLRMEATAYDPGPRSCGKYADGTTANGMKAQKGVVAVDTRLIPLGTKLYIPGYGLAIAADRGSAIKGNRIDLCFNTYAEAVRFGRRMVDVYILR